VLQHAQVKHLTFHGLRRTFIRQARNIAPAGVPAQIAGHAPSAVAEGYAVLSMDELRPHAERVEAHILSLAGAQFDAQAVPGALRVVAG
jgi:integrase